MTSNNIEHPSHYNQSEIETWDLTKAFQLDAYTFNAIKYLMRAGNKGTDSHIVDLEKATQYLEKYDLENPSISIIYKDYYLFKEDNSKLFSYAVSYVMSKIELTVSKNIYQAIELILLEFPVINIRRVINLIDCEIIEINGVLTAREILTEAGF